VVNINENLWVHTKLGRQLLKIERNGRTNYDCLWHQVTV
jgi:hypothetical protein